MRIRGNKISSSKLKVSIFLMRENSLGCEGGFLSRAKTDSQGPLQVAEEPGNEFSVFV